MKPTVKLAETTGPDGAKFMLTSHDGEYYLAVNGRNVMSTNLTHSEIMLADIGCQFVKDLKSPRILIGGLGLGFSLRRALELTGPKAEVVVAELLPAVVTWNRELLDGLNDSIMDDPRTQIVQRDVYQLIRKATGKGPGFDAILLDVDDGPSSLIQKGNSQIYEPGGLETISAALNPGGRLAIWAAEAEPALLKGLRKAGFITEEIPCARHIRAKRQQHCIYLADPRD